MSQTAGKLHDLSGHQARRERQRMFDAGQTTCRYCSKPLTPETATIDHVLPISLGGDHSPQNMVLSCQPCNHRRGEIMDHASYEEYGEPVALSTGEWRRRKRRIETPTKAGA